MTEIRQATLNDFDFYYQLKCEKSSVYWSGFSGIPDRNQLYAFWKHLIDGKIVGRKIYILSVNLSPVGYIQVVEDNGRFELSMGIAENDRGKGYGNLIIQKAIELNGLRHTYYCYIREDNDTSIKSFKKNGFKKTGFSYKQEFGIDNKEYQMNEYIRESLKVIAIIPARCGSKGLSNKNIRLLNGKPLLAYSVEAAIESEIFDTVHVSTDSKKYADIASMYGADEPFLRDIINSGDSSSSWDAVREVLRKYKEIGKEFDVCVLLQPTSPMRMSEDIKEAYMLFKEKKAKSLTSVTEVDHPVQWCFKLDATYFMKDFATSPYKACRRQELEKYYRENGAIYIVGTSEIADHSFDFYSDQCVAYVMNRERSIDIDTLQDFIIAETIMQMQSEEQK